MSINGYIQRQCLENWSAIVNAATISIQLARSHCLGKNYLGLIFLEPVQDRREYRPTAIGGGAVDQEQVVS
jgi:hypothetical protein